LPFHEHFAHSYRTRILFGFPTRTLKTINCVSDRVSCTESCDLHRGQGWPWCSSEIFLSAPPTRTKLGILYLMKVILAKE
jgi:hypothetical protein